MPRRRWSVLIAVAIIVATTAVVGVRGGGQARGQAPTASHGQPLTGPIQCTPHCLIPIGAVEPPAAVVPPAGSVTFTNFPPGFVYTPPAGLSPNLPPGAPIPTPVPRLFVTNASGQLATVTFETALTIAAPPGFAVQVDTPTPATCAPVEGQPHVVRCVDLPFPPERLTFRAVPLAAQGARGPGTSTLQPGERAEFRYPVGPSAPGQPTPRGLPPPITAENRSDAAVTAIYDGFRLRLEAPRGLLIRIVEGEGRASGCRPHTGAVVACDAFAGTNAIFTVVPIAWPTEALPLSSGCNMIVLTWPPLTPLDIVAEAVTPSGALESIWRFNPARDRFMGFAPGAPHTEYREILAPLEAVFLCLRQPGTLTRPIPGAVP